MNFNTYWQGLTNREKIMGVIGTALTLIFLLYQLVISPLLTTRAQQEAQLREKKMTLAFMQEAQKENLTGTQKKTINNNQLLTLIATQLATESFTKYPDHLQLTEEGNIQISFEKVPYPLFTKWLWTLQQENKQISLKQVSFEQTDTTGVIKVLVLLQMK